MELTTRVRELAAWLLAAAAAGAGPAAAQPAEYHVRISVTPLEAHVRATLPVAGTRLAMDEAQADHLPDGWPRSSGT